MEGSSPFSVVGRPGFPLETMVGESVNELLVSTFSGDVGDPVADLPLRTVLRESVNFLTALRARECRCFENSESRCTVVSDLLRTTNETRLESDDLSVSTFSGDVRSPAVDEFPLRRVLREADNDLFLPLRRVRESRCFEN